MVIFYSLNLAVAVIYRWMCFSGSDENAFLATMVDLFVAIAR